MIKFYQYFAWLITTPLAYHLLKDKQQLDLLILAVLWAYIFPAVGTNIAKVWEFNLKGKIGRFKFYHGFAFGSSTIILLYLISSLFNFLPNLINYLLTSCILTYINVYWDKILISKNILFVYNKPWAKNQSPSKIVNEYAYIIFGLFFFIFNLFYFKLIELNISNSLFNHFIYSILTNYFNPEYIIFTTKLLILLFIPLIVYCLKTKLLYNYLGLTPAKKINSKAKTLSEYLEK